MIVQGLEGHHASTLPEKEELVRWALSAQRTPWVSVFRVGAPCAHGQALAWFPCTLLISAVRGSRRAAMEYRCWRPETTPKFDRQDIRRCFAEFIDQLRPGTWISCNNTGTSVADLFLRGSRVQADEDTEDKPQAKTVYFPRTAPVPDLNAARAIRAFFRNGQRTNHITWTKAPPWPDENTAKPIPHTLAYQ